VNDDAVTLAEGKNELLNLSVNKRAKKNVHSTLVLYKIVAAGFFIRELSPTRP
jgi:hypothetical protein